MYPGHFICLEGIEGAGKTTQIGFIQEYLRSKHKPVLTTREPGGTPLAERIRQVILDSQHSQERIAPDTELLLLFAARQQHITEVIEPALQNGYWVICDRFTESSYAYQGSGRGISWDFIDSLTSHIHKHLEIDRVILLDIPVSTAIERLHKRQYQYHQPLDRIEAESLEFFERVRQGYLNRAKALLNYRVIDANCPLIEMKNQITTVLNELLSQA
jgi:dTMP kinase